MYLYVFLFLTLNTVFYNQMNGIRQYIALYFFTLAILINKSIFEYMINFLIGIFIHRSLLGLFHIYFIFNIFIKKINNKKVYILLLMICITLYFINISEIIYFFMKTLVSRYSWYFNSIYNQSFEFKKI